MAFLIDADNLSSAAFVEEACSTLADSEGLLLVRRAYGSAEALKNLAESMRKWAIRPFCNLYLSKNTTDMALAIDAMELACQSPRPDVIAIGSGDADFLPLVVRLRERGIRMVCVTAPSTMAHEADHAYHRVLFVGSTRAPSRDTPPDSDPEATTAAHEPYPQLAAAKAPATAKPKKATAASPSAKPSVTARQILHHVPALKSHQPLHLGDVAKALRDVGLLGKNASTTKLLKQFGKTFELTPAKQPNQVRYTATTA